MTPRQQQAERLVQKLNEDRRWLDETAARFNPGTGHCCPSCACPEYSERCDAQMRRLQALVVQTKRDALPQHLKALQREISDMGYMTVEQLMSVEVRR